MIHDETGNKYAKGKGQSEQGTAYYMSQQQLRATTTAMRITWTNVQGIALTRSLREWRVRRHSLYVKIWFDGPKWAKAIAWQRRSDNNTVNTDVMGNGIELQSVYINTTTGSSGSNPGCSHIFAFLLWFDVRSVRCVGLVQIHTSASLSTV